MTTRSFLLSLVGAALIFGTPAYVVATVYPGWDSWAMYGVACLTTVAGLASIAPRGHVTRRRELVRHYAPKGR